MSQVNTREVVLLASQTTTTSGTGPDINLVQGWQSAIVSVVTSTTSGTSPTFDIYIQQKLGQAASTDLSGNPPTGTAIYDDVLHFTQITTNKTKLIHVCAGPNSPSANATTATTSDWDNSDAAIAAGALRIGPIGGQWRVKYTVGGTTPSTVLYVTAMLVPFGT